LAPRGQLTTNPTAMVAHKIFCYFLFVVIVVAVVVAVFAVVAAVF